MSTDTPAGRRVPLATIRKVWRALKITREHVPPSTKRDEVDEAIAEIEATLFMGRENARSTRRPA